MRLIVPILCVLALASCGGGDEKPAYVVRVGFVSDGALPIESGAPVKVEGGDEIGEVGPIEPGPQRTQVTTLLIDDEQVAPLRIDTTARVRSGAVELRPGRHGTPIPDGGVIPTGNTYPVP